MNTITPSPFWTEEDLIYSYTRADAIRDGVLIEVPASLAKEAGIISPVALTSGAWRYIDPGNLTEMPGQSVKGRLWDLLQVFRVVARQARHTNRIRFTVAFLMCYKEINKNMIVDYEESVAFQAICGPGDTLEPVITIMLPWED